MSDKQIEFIRLRASGLSYDAISKKLHISKGTAVNWGHELESEIAALKSEGLEELFINYGMVKTSRIKALGDTLHKINDAIDEADFSKIPISTLLRLKLDYQKALRDEYTPHCENAEIITPENVISALNGVLVRVRRGDLTSDQLQKELAAIRALQQAIEDIELNAKLEELERILNDR